MPRKGMKSLCFTPNTSSYSISLSETPRRSFSDSVMDRSLELAEGIIMKWNPETSAFAKVTSLFYESRREATEFIKCVNDLQKAMHFLATENSNSDLLVRGQILMQIAMKRLQNEFYQILSMNRAQLDPESVSARSSRASTRSSISDYEDEEDDETQTAGDSISEVEDASTLIMTDLRLIAECMISSGYGKECVKIYNIIRKSIVDETIYRVGVEKVTSSQIHKMDWEVLDMRIKTWLNAVKVSMKTLFNGERILCDHVFASSDTIREACFSEISKEGATILFGFPEIVAKSNRKLPIKVFRVLDMYTSIASHWPDIDSIFSLESTANIQSQALTSLIKLGDCVRALLTDFESNTQKDKAKIVVAGAGIHPLTLDVMNYLSLLADYSNVLADILADEPSPASSSLPGSYFDAFGSEESELPPMTLRFAWLILVLLCKLDGKAKHYKDVSLSYLFLSNNLQHVISRVCTSNIRYLLGDDWISKHELKVKQFGANYERLAWEQVIKSMPADPNMVISPEEVKDYFKRFNTVFEEAERKQSLCVIPNNKLRDDIKLSIAKKLVPKYTEFYNKNRETMERERRFAHLVRYSPEDLENHLSDLYFGTPVSGSSFSFSSPSSTSSHSHPSRSNW